MRLIVDAIGSLRTRRRHFAALQAAGRSQKISFTHLIAYAIVQAVRQQPVMGHTLAMRDGVPYRIQPEGIALGLAVDVQRKDGSRGLVVPVISRAFDPPLNLSNHRGIGFWLRGDGQGGSFKLQLMDRTRAMDYYVKNDYTGWRYHQLPRPEKDAIDYAGVRSLLLYYNGVPGERTVTCGIDDIRALPAIDKLEVTDPWVEVGGRRFAWPGAVGEGQYLEFWPGEAAQRHAPAQAEPQNGKAVEVSTIEPGDHEVKVGAARGIGLPLRVRVTVQPPERHDIE